MRFDVPLVSVSLAASAAATIPPSYAAPNATALNITAPIGNFSSSPWGVYGKTQHKYVLELQAEIAALKGQLSDVSKCAPATSLPVDPAATTSSAPSSWGTGSWPTTWSVPNTYVTTTIVNGKTITKTITIAASSPAPSGGMWPVTYGSDEPTTYLTTTVVNGKTITKTITIHATATSTFDCNPAHAYPNGAKCVSSGSGLTLVTPTPSATYSAPADPALPATPDYYAHAPPGDDWPAKDLPTYTTYVTPGQSTPTSYANATGPQTAYTCTQTYLGTAPIPNRPVWTAPPVISILPNISIHLSLPTALPSIQLSIGAPYPVSSGFHTYPGNGTSGFATGTGTAVSGTAITGTAVTTPLANTISSSTSSSTTAAATDCAKFCSTLTSLNGYEVTPLTCTQLAAGVLVNTPAGQSSVGCAASFTPSLDICQVTLNVKTSGTGNVYQEVWLPTGNSSVPSTWNGRTMSTDNGGLNGCIHYVDMQYVSGKGFAAIGDNAGHNGSSFDGTWTMNNNEAIIDWAYRARHASVDVGKQVVNSFYGKAADKSYYIGCSTGGAQGLKSAQNYPTDFDGIIAGASAADFNHLQSWSAHFRLLTGAVGNDTFLTAADWTTVQTTIFAQCDEALDGVPDGILEDPMQCIGVFDSSKIPICSDTVTSACLTPTQVQTVNDVFKPLYNSAGKLIYPGLLHGAQVDAFKLGLLNGGVQGIAQDFFRGGVYNNSAFDITTIGPKDYDAISALDELHGYPSSFSGDLSSFASSGSKLIMYHGMADPMTSGSNSQRYYQKVAATTSSSPAEIDDYLRLFRISGMAHCGVGGISGAGAWQFGQAGNALGTNNIVDNLVSWVEQGDAPETLLGTKYWYDTPAYGVEFERPHCRFPYRTTFKSGDSTKPENWDCVFIDDWQKCEGITCDADGTFT